MLLVGEADGEADGENLGRGGSLLLFDSAGFSSGDGVLDREENDLPLPPAEEKNLEPKLDRRS